MAPPPRYAFMHTALMRLRASPDKARQDIARAMGAAWPACVTVDQVRSSSRGTAPASKSQIRGTPRRCFRPRSLSLRSHEVSQQAVVGIGHPPMQFWQARHRDRSFHIDNQFPLLKTGCLH